MIPEGGNSDTKGGSGHLTGGIWTAHPVLGILIKSYQQIDLSYLNKFVDQFTSLPRTGSIPITLSEYRGVGFRKCQKRFLGGTLRGREI